MTADDEQPAHVFQSLWVGERLSPLEHLCIKSFLANGHAFVLYVYGEVDNVPQGCTVEDARMILPEESVFLHPSGIHIGTPSPFSDRFRYELLRARGGWWVDTDALCLTSDIPETPYVFGKENDDDYVGGILKAPPKSEFLSRAIARCEQARGDIEFIALGPLLVNELVRELGLEHHAWPREYLYPLGPGQALEFFDPAQADRIEALTSSAIFVHFYTHMLRVATVLKDLRPPASSYLDRLYQAYDIDFPTDRRYAWAELRPRYEFEKEHWSLWAEVDALRTERARATAVIQALRQDVTRLQGELQRTRDLLRNMKVVRWSAPARRIVYRLRERRACRRRGAGSAASD